MNPKDDVTVIEKIRYWIYQQSWWLIFLLSTGFSIGLFYMGTYSTIIEHAEAISVTGMAIAAFQFTAQNILLTVPEKNAFIQIARNEGYFVFLHKFCRRSEIVFAILLIPMLFINDCPDMLMYNILIISLYLYALFFTIWTMWLIGKLLVRSEEL